MKRCVSSHLRVREADAPRRGPIKYESSDDEPITKYLSQTGRSELGLSESVKFRIREEVRKALGAAKLKENYVTVEPKARKPAKKRTNKLKEAVIEKTQGSDGVTPPVQPQITPVEQLPIEYNPEAQGNGNARLYIQKSDRDEEMTQATDGMYPQRHCNYFSTTL